MNSEPQIEILNPQDSGELESLAEVFGIEKGY